MKQRNYGMYALAAAIVVVEDAAVIADAAAPCRTPCAHWS